MTQTFIKKLWCGIILDNRIELDFCNVREPSVGVTLPFGLPTYILLQYLVLASIPGMIINTSFIHTEYERPTNKSPPCQQDNKVLIIEKGCVNVRGSNARLIYQLQFTSLKTFSTWKHSPLSPHKQQPWWREMTVHHPSSNSWQVFKMPCWIFIKDLAWWWLPAAI